MRGLGVACVTYCVGGLNMLNSVACAYAEKSPLVVISGGPATTDRKTELTDSTAEDLRRRWRWRNHLGAG